MYLVEDWGAKFFILDLPIRRPAHANAADQVEAPPLRAPHFHLLPAEGSVHAEVKCSRKRTWLLRHGKNR